MIMSFSFKRLTQNSLLWFEIRNRDPRHNLLLITCHLERRMIPSAYLFKNTTLKIAPRIITHLPLPDSPPHPPPYLHTHKHEKNLNLVFLEFYFYWNFWPKIKVHFSQHLLIFNNNLFIKFFRDCLFLYTWPTMLSCFACHVLLLTSM